MSNTKKIVIVFVVVVFAVVAGSALVKYVEKKDAAKYFIIDPTSPINAQDIEYGDGLTGYIAHPAEPGTYPGLVLIHEWWGLNDNIKDMADRYAEEGYVALAVDMYDGAVATEADDARDLATKVRGDMDGAFANLKSATDFLKSHEMVEAEKLASVGWCFGGGWSYEMAKNNLDVNASVIYYGRFNPEDDLSQMRTNILGHFGEDDTSIKIDDVKTFQATLKTLKGDHEVFIYPNAGHGFANENNYAPEAADQAWVRTVQFLREQL